MKTFHAYCSYTQHGLNPAEAGGITTTDVNCIMNSSQAWQAAQFTSYWRAQRGNVTCDN